MGILSLREYLPPSDAKKTLSLGVDEIVVSNHGGRNMDARPTSLSALPKIAERRKLQMLRIETWLPVNKLFIDAVNEYLGRNGTSPVA